MRMLVATALAVMTCAWVVLGPPVEEAEAHGRVVKVESTKLWTNSFCVSGRSIMRHSTRWEHVQTHAGTRERSHKKTVYNNTYQDYKYGSSQYSTSCDVWGWKRDKYATRIVTGGIVAECSKDDENCRERYSDRDQYEEYDRGHKYEYERVYWVRLRRPVRIE